MNYRFHFPFISFIGIIAKSSEEFRVENWNETERKREIGGRPNSENDNVQLRPRFSIFYRIFARMNFMNRVGKSIYSIRQFDGVLCRKIAYMNEPNTRMLKTHIQTQTQAMYFIHLSRLLPFLTHCIRPIHCRIKFSTSLHEKRFLSFEWIVEPMPERSGGRGIGEWVIW